MNVIKIVMGWVCVGVRVEVDISILLSNYYPQSGVKGFDKDKNLCKFYIYLKLNFGMVSCLYIV